MKTVTKFFLLTQFLLSFAGCDSVSDSVIYMANSPVYMSREDFNITAKTVEGQTLKNPGKICLYGDFLFINEVGKGIHVIDNTNPSSPNNVAFIEITGNIDLAAKDGILYADNLVDMLLFDISDPRSPRLKTRMENVFEGVFPAPSNEYPVVSKIDTSRKVIVGWEQKKVKEEVVFNYPRWYYPEYALNVASDSRYSWSKNSLQPGINIIGVNGSMSRFAITDNCLYAIYIKNVVYNQSPAPSTNYYTTGELKVFDLREGGVKQVNSVFVNNTVETLFAYRDYLFMGMSNGMQIYSIANPVAPVYVSSAWHFWGCDPVVVDENYAYLTVRSTNTCGQNGNLLQVYDIKEIRQPTLVSQFDMQEPYGLGIDGNKLFICDKGLKVFDATNPRQVGQKLLFSTTDFKGYDLIPYNNLLLVIGDNGLYQYSYSSDNQLNRLSVIPVTK